MKLPSNYSFGVALYTLQAGGSAQRRGWNGKDLWIKLQMPDENSKMTKPYIYIEYPDGQRVPWLASQTDLLSEDWVLDMTPNKQTK